MARQLATALGPATGFALPIKFGSPPSGNRIVLRRDASLAQLGSEGYRLEVRPGAITIRAPQPAGLFYGVQSLRLLLPVDIFREARVAGGGRLGRCRPS